MHIRFLDAVKTEYAVIEQRCLNSWIKWNRHPVS